MIVIDASVAIQCVLPEAQSAAARELVLAEFCVAPDLIVSECMNALWKSVRRDRITEQEARLAAKAFSDISIELVTSASLSGRALELALMFDHPVYDCFYLALAEERGGDLITSDRSLRRKCADARLNTVSVRLLGDDQHD